MKQSDPFSVKKSVSDFPPFEVLLYHLQNWVQILKLGKEGHYWMLPASCECSLSAPSWPAPAPPFPTLYMCPLVCLGHSPVFLFLGKSEVRDHVLFIFLSPASSIWLCWKPFTPKCLIVRVPRMMRYWVRVWLGLQVDNVFQNKKSWGSLHGFLNSVSSLSLSCSFQ